MFSDECMDVPLQAIFVWKLIIVFKHITCNQIWILLYLINLYLQNCQFKSRSIISSLIIPYVQYSLEKKINIKSIWGNQKYKFNYKENIFKISYLDIRNPYHVSLKKKKRKNFLVASCRAFTIKIKVGNIDVIDKFIFQFIYT